jgi:hypothetical protein
MTDNNDKEYVIVKMEMMFGDADAYRHGIKVMPKSKWEKEINIMKKVFAKHNISEVESWNDVVGRSRVTLDCWEVKPCTAEETQVFKNLVGEDYFGRFDFPSEFLYEYLNDDDYEDLYAEEDV